MEERTESEIIMYYNIEISQRYTTYDIIYRTL